MSSCTKQEAFVEESLISSPQIEERGAVPTFCYEEFEVVDVATITTCPTVFSPASITETVPFYDYSTNDLIAELKDIFYCNNEFSTCTGAPIPQEICTAQFKLVDDKVFDTPFPPYPYFSDAITPALSNQIKQYFACEIIEYAENHYDTYDVAHVNFTTNQTLCTCSDGIGDQIFLVATANYYIY